MASPLSTREPKAHGGSRHRGATPKSDVQKHSRATRGTVKNRGRGRRR